MNRHAQDLPDVPPGLLDGIVRDLGLADHPHVQRIKSVLAAHARSFALARYIERGTPTLHEDVRRAAELSILISDLARMLQGFSPERAMVLQAAFEQKAEERGNWKELQEQLKLLGEIMERFGSASFARRRKDDFLYDAVGGLMLRLTNITGEKVTVQRRNSDRNLEPRLSSPGARAIASLLRVAEPDLQDTTLVNVIAKIASNAKTHGMREFEHQLLLGGRITHF